MLKALGLAMPYHSPSSPLSLMGEGAKLLTLDEGDIEKTGGETTSYVHAPAVTG